MAQISVNEAAKHLGVVPQRVRRMIANGQVHAEKVGGRWLVEVASLPHGPRVPGRPMSPRIAWALILHGDNPADAGWLRPDEAYRLRKRIETLSDDPDPAVRLQAWLANRADTYHLHAQDVPAVLKDERLVPSGISDPRSQMSAARRGEGYTRTDALEDLTLDHLLVPATPARSNFTLHVTAIMPMRPVPEVLLAADLADRGGPRETIRSGEVFQEWLTHQVGLR